MAFDAFVVFTTQSGQPPLVGETQDAQFHAKGAIEITSFSFGIHNTLSIGSASGGAGAGKAQLMELKISKVVDRVSPSLLQYVGSGAHFAQMDLYLRKAGGGSKTGLVFLQYSFKLVSVSNVEWSGGTGEDTVKEDVSFVYGALQIKYTSQKASGQAGDTYTGTWNQVKNNSSFAIPGVG